MGCRCLFSLFNSLKLLAEGLHGLFGNIYTDKSTHDETGEIIGMAY